MVIIEYKNAWELQRCNQMADKALQIDSKHVNSLSTKGESLDSIHIDQFQECWVNIPKLVKFVIKHQMLIHIMINPQGVKEPVQTNFNSCNCIQELSKYSEAIIYYNKALQINPDYLWLKVKKLNVKNNSNKNSERQMINQLFILLKFIKIAEILIKKILLILKNLQQIIFFLQILKYLLNATFNKYSQ